MSPFRGVGEAVGPLDADEACRQPSPLVSDQDVHGFGALRHVVCDLLQTNGASAVIPQRRHPGEERRRTGVQHRGHLALIPCRSPTAHEVDAWQNPRPHATEGAT
jgi:hypothetical protein